jgi:hypothetical protein
VQARLNQLAGGNALSAPTGGTNCEALASGSALVCVYDNNNQNVSGVNTGSNTSPLDMCQVGYKLEISSKYTQQLFVPLIGNLLSNNGSGSTRTLTADVEATCEQ